MHILPVLRLAKFYSLVLCRFPAVRSEGLGPPDDFAGTIASAVSSVLGGPKTKEEKGVASTGIKVNSHEFIR